MEFKPVHLIKEGKKNSSHRLGEKWLGGWDIITEENINYIIGSDSTEAETICHSHSLRSETSAPLCSEANIQWLFNSPDTLRRTGQDPVLITLLWSSTHSKQHKHTAQVQVQESFLGPAQFKEMFCSESVPWYMLQWHLNTACIWTYKITEAASLHL